MDIPSKSALGRCLFQFARRFRPLLLAGLLCSFVASLGATEIASHTFEATSPAYSVGALSEQNSWSAALWSVTAGGLSSASISGGTQHVQIDGPAVANQRANIAFSSTTADTVYARFNVRYTGTYDSTDFFWFGLSGGNGSSDNNSAGFVIRDGTGGSPLEMYARSYVSAATNSTANLAFAYGTTYTVVLKASKSTPSAANPYDRVSVFVNPDLSYSSSDPGTSTVNTTTSIGSASLTGLFFRVGAGGALDSGENIQVDSIIVGTSWADIVPVNPNPTALAFTSVNGGNNPVAGAPFSIVVRAQDATGTAAPVVANTAISLSVQTGSAALGGTVTGTILAGQSSGTISGVTYPNPEVGVVLSATVTSGDTLTLAQSQPVTFTAAVLTPTSTSLARAGATGTTSTYGDTLTFQATVTGGTPTGTVRLRLGSASGTIIGTGTLSSGSCQISVNSALPPGTYSNIVAVYEGDIIHATSVSFPLSPAQTVSPKPLTITGLTANNKSYDGTTAATFSGSPALLSAIAPGTGNGSDGRPYSGDTVTASIASATAAFVDPAIGNNKSVVVTGVTLTGTSAAYYSPIQPTGLTANIVLSAVSGVPATTDFETSRPVTTRSNDFDGDGLPDILELALGTNNSVSDAPTSLLTPLPQSNGMLDIRYLRALNPGRFTPVVESSTDLVNWGTANITQEFQLTPQGNFTEVTARIPGPAQRQFARLRASDAWEINALAPNSTSDYFKRICIWWSTYLNAQGTGDVYPGSGDTYEWTMRMLVPMASWLSQPGRPKVITWNGTSLDVAEALRKALVNGTAPAGTTGRWAYATASNDQIVVEAPQVAYAVWLLHQAKLAGAPGGDVWDTFTSDQRTNINTFLENTGRASYANSYGNNWSNFIAICHQARKQLEAAGVTEFSGWSQSAIDTSLGNIQNLHRGGGWYKDNSGTHDDYMPWAIAPDQMVVFMMGAADTQTQTEIPGTTPPRGRSQILGDISDWLLFQVLTFDPAGRNPEYGRSSNYKFGRLRTLATAYYMDRVYNTPGGWNLGFNILPPEISRGTLRRLLRLHLSHYLTNGMVNTVTGELKDGQTPESAPGVLESYRADGSRFWSMMSVAALLQLPDNDPLWSTSEESLPSEIDAYESWFQVPGLLVRNLPDQGHLELFNARVARGLSNDNNYLSKYSKYTYSTLFGYCTAGGTLIDQSITVGTTVRDNPTSGSLFLRYGRAADEPGVIRTNDTIGTASVKTLIFLKDGLQLRVSRITNAGGQTISEGGYALGHGASETPPAAQTGADWVYMESSVGAVFTARVLGYTAMPQISGTGNHARNAKWRLAYAELPAPASQVDVAILSMGSARRFDPVAARAKLSSITITGTRVDVVWSDGTQDAANFE